MDFILKEFEEFNCNKAKSLYHVYKANANASFNGTVNRIITTILAIMFWDFLMFYQIFLPPQVKQITIISEKHGIYELPHVFSHNLGLKIFIELWPSVQSSFQNEDFMNTNKKLFKNWNWTFLMVQCFTLTLNFASYKFSLDCRFNFSEVFKNCNEFFLQFFKKIHHWMLFANLKK